MRIRWTKNSRIMTIVRTGWRAPRVRHVEDLVGRDRVYIKTTRKRNDDEAVKYSGKEMKNRPEIRIQKF